MWGNLHTIQSLETGWNTSLPARCSSLQQQQQHRGGGGVSEYHHTNPLVRGSVTMVMDDDQYIRGKVHGSRLSAGVGSTTPEDPTDTSATTTTTTTTATATATTATTTSTTTPEAPSSPCA